MTPLEENIIAGIVIGAGLIGSLWCWLLVIDAIDAFKHWRRKR